MEPLIIVTLVSIAILAFVIYTVLDVIKSDFRNDTNKTIWVLFILLVAPIGSIFYMILGRKQKIK
ncbi:PLDc N-terminal domain-containing protein [Campylobacterota bacterium DY0563]|uniref:PLDc N-terminal domain-containing protein n=1 Tax=Halarcobacter sp. TaxID=2321133 RepID=UPI0029F5CADD|nr:PLDc N-terminal domain-containing protein [Halarcobacter sp.]